jgi:hypothetical protein
MHRMMKELIDTLPRGEPHDVQAALLYLLARLVEVWRSSGERCEQRIERLVNEGRADYDRDLQAEFDRRELEFLKNALHWALRKSGDVRTGNLRP